TSFARHYCGFVIYAQGRGGPVARVSHEQDDGRRQSTTSVWRAGHADRRLSGRARARARARAGVAMAAPFCVEASMGETRFSSPWTRRGFLGATLGCAAHVGLALAGGAAVTRRAFGATSSRSRVVAQEPWGRLERIADGVWA